jgi:hypothetical protein
LKIIIITLQAEGRRFEPVSSHTENQGFRKIKLLKPFFLAKKMQEKNDKSGRNLKKKSVN